MPDTLLLETGTDRFLLEDGSGFLLMEVPVCYFDVVMADNPVSYWRLGEASGETVAIDVQGTNPGTYVASPTLGTTGFLTGDTNKAVTFNGSTQYVDVLDSASLDLGDGPLSIEFWVNQGATQRSILDKGTGSFLVTTDGSGNIAFLPNGSTELAHSQGAVTDFTNHHVVLTKNGSSVFVYLDGVNKTVLSTPGTVLTNTATNLALGANAIHTDFFSGKLDEIAIYNTVLTAVQVQTHYNSAVAGCARHFGPIVLQSVSRAATR